ncbi:hypothetical protein M011DRAFT_509439 [Sporormia fimetaria CBS 119925]|uniref:Ubiquitin-like 1-activating enzyme E1A n=1 Tax=Sporormia fimetaria CBS 119925 TaxID=1340428 RepID=A0A6A6VHK2_9PLEO|nr:hypothetical protein M011DRAFT_509439 [Sporormia fimetaria CBS 119925]
MQTPDAPLPEDSGSQQPVFPASDAAGTSVAAIAQAETISADEVALYDRQIRLWGMKAQENIRKANILLVGIRALANEVAKNLVLAGIGSITLADDQLVTEEDLGAQFLCTDADIGKNRAAAAAVELQKLNPRVQVHTITTDVTKNQDMSFYAAYDFVIATDLDFDSLNHLDAAARLAHKPFYAAASHGFYGFIFADLGMHDFVIERERSNRPTVLGPETNTRTIIGATEKKEGGKNIEFVEKREVYTPLLLANTSPLPATISKYPRKLRKVHPLLTCIRALWEFQRNSRYEFPADTHEDLVAFMKIATEKHKELSLPVDSLRAEFVRAFLQNLGSELAPVTAVLGGQLAQDAINVLSHREQPIQNLMLFDGDTTEAPIYSLHPIVASDPVPQMPVPPSVTID